MTESSRGGSNDHPRQPSTSLVPRKSSPPADQGKEYGLATIKGLIGAVPFAGTLLNEIVFEARSRLKQRRLEEFVRELAISLAEVESSRIDRDYLHTEEFSDLAEDVLLRVSRNRSEKKRQHFRNILVGSITGVRAPDFSALFLNLLEEMTDDEIRVYTSYYRTYVVLRKRRSEGKRIDVAAIDYTQKVIMGISTFSYKQIIQSFIRKGLLFDDSHGRLSTPAYAIVEPTELGASFFEWIDPESATKIKEEYAPEAQD
jgi:hypothetical protein